MIQQKDEGDEKDDEVVVVDDGDGDADDDEDEEMVGDLQQWCMHGSASNHPTKYPIKVNKKMNPIDYVSLQLLLSLHPMLEYDYSHRLSQVMLTCLPLYSKHYHPQSYRTHRVNKVKVSLQQKVTLSIPTDSALLVNGDGCYWLLWWWKECCRSHECRHRSA